MRIIRIRLGDMRLNPIAVGRSRRSWRRCDRRRCGRQLACQMPLDSGRISPIRLRNFERSRNRWCEKLPYDRSDGSFAMRILDETLQKSGHAKSSRR